MVRPDAGHGSKIIPELPPESLAALDVAGAVRYHAAGHVYVPHERVILLLTVQTSLTLYAQQRPIWVVPRE
jgi:hypothetical protein